MLSSTTPSTSVSKRCNGVLSPWYDIDDPTGDGDFERLEVLQRECGACKNPTAIYARLLVGGADYTAGGEVVTISVTLGFSCKNKDQSDGRCNDYEVQLCCPNICKLTIAYTIITIAICMLETSCVISLAQQTGSSSNVTINIVQW